jgi:hypothetical protein
MRPAVLVFAACAVVAVAAAADDDDQIPERFTNLQVLPKDITRPQMLDLMKGMSRSLGVDCEHCHVEKGEETDFAADDKREKKAARVMIHMTGDINQKLRAVTTETRVSCWTCHRGEAKPAPAPAAPGKSVPPKTPGRP